MVKPITIVNGVLTEHPDLTIEDLSGNSWIEYVTRGEYVATTPDIGGDILEYSFGLISVYRFVPDPYNYDDDAFYDDSSKTNLLARRGIQ